LECADEEMDHTEWRLMVHVIASNGLVVSEFHLPFRHAERIRVDEWTDRIYVPSPPEDGDRGSTVQVCTLDGRPVMTIHLGELRPALGWLDDLAIDPERHGIVLLDSDHHRIIRIAHNGTLDGIHFLGAKPLRITDIAVGPRGNVVYSVMETFAVNSTFAHNSSILEIDVNGTVVDTFVGFGDPPTNGPTFGAISVGRDGQLFAFDHVEQTVFAWEHSPHPPPGAEQESKAAVMSSDVGRRHQRLSGQRM